MDLDTDLYFTPNSLAAKEVVEIIKFETKFNPTQIQTETFCKLGCKFKPDVHLNKILESSQEWINLTTDSNLAGPYFDYSNTWNGQHLWWHGMLVTHSPSDAFIEELTKKQGFIAAYQASSEDLKWQNCIDVNSYKWAGKPYKHLPTFDDPPFGKRIDISKNPGRFHFMPYTKLMSCYKIWLSPDFYKKYVTKERLLSFSSAKVIKELSSGTFFVQLYDDPFKANLSNYRKIQQEFRDWIDMDKIVSHSKRELAELSKKEFEKSQDKNQINPYGFGYKMEWMVVNSNDIHTVAKFLRLKNVVTVNCLEGIISIYENPDNKVLITKPINNWIFIVGFIPRKNYQDLKNLLIDLSKEFKEAQYFGNHRVSDYYACGKAVGGKIETFFVSETDLYNEGVEDDEPLCTDEKEVLEIAEKWGLNPLKVNFYAVGDGLYGKWQ